MLKFTKFREPCAKTLLPFGRVIREMTDSPVRSHFKRMACENREQHLMKLKRLKRDEPDYSNLKLLVVGNGAYGCSASVVICAQHKSYLFNCGEGTQRLCTEYRVRIPRITNMFFTSSSWENLGGVPGYILTAQALGVPSLTIHGAKNIGKLLESTQQFVRVEYMDILPHEKDYYEDEVLRVKQVKLESSLSTKEDQDERFAYICRAYDKPGQLVLEKCVEKGVPAGPLFSRLKSGEEITLENGKVVKPSDVMMPTTPGPVVIILECPSEDYVRSLLASEEIVKYQNSFGSDPNYHATCVVHMTPSAVYESKSYQKFLKRFAHKTRHLQLHELNTSAVSTAAYRAIARLNLINDEIFPMLPTADTTSVSPMTTLNLRRNELVKDPKYDISIDKFVEEVRALKNFDTIRADLQKRVESISCLDNREYPKLTFLGTGSCQPTKDRNVSAILVRPTENVAFLLDCGESTWNQLVRAFGIEKADELVAQLKFIYISHLHADHHLGLAGILLRRQMIGITDELTVIAPSFLPPWLNEFSKIFRKISCNYRNCRDFMKYALAPETYSSRLDVKCITTCFVEHCPESFGVRVDLDNYSLVYSGDTQPCSSLIKLGTNCDLLIHEATMEDDLVRDARLKAHSTTSQAKEIGEKMNAKFTLLTHFSQRYCKLPSIDENHFANGRLGLAFDYMHVSPKNLHILPHIYPMLKCVYPDHFEDLQEKTQKYAIREARMASVV